MKDYYTALLNYFFPTRPIKPPNTNIPLWAQKEYQEKKSFISPVAGQVPDWAVQEFCSNPKKF